MKHSELINEIAAALAAAQAEMSNPAFDRDNPYFKSKYATLAAVRDAVVPCLSKHGISVTQELVESSRIITKVWTDKQSNELQRLDDYKVGGCECTTYLFHSSGQWMQYDPWFMPCEQFTAQGISSAATYAKRTSLQAVCGVVGDVDDDVNEATFPSGAGAPKDKPRAASAPPQPPKSKSATEEPSADVQEWQTKLANCQTPDEANKVYEKIPTEIRKLPHTQAILAKMKQKWPKKIEAPAAPPTEPNDDDVPSA